MRHKYGCLMMKGCKMNEWNEGEVCELMKFGGKMGVGFVGFEREKRKGEREECVCACVRRGWGIIFSRFVLLKR
jgi:hypothetical protein